MKNLDRFIGQMMASARMVQNKDMSGATAVIQQALAQAGLTPTTAASFTTSTAATATEEAPEFVDLNPAPGWNRRPKPRFVRPTPSAPAQHLPGHFLSGSHRCETGTRRYKLYIPAAAIKAPATRRPLLVMLHGCTQNPDDFANGTKMNALSEEFGCLVLYPEQDKSANHNGCWNWFEPGHQVRGAGEAALIASMTRHIIAEHDAEPSQVFVAGLSAGGAMAAILGAEYPELYAAIGVHSGLPAGSARDLITGLQAMKKPGRGRSVREAVPLIVIHGDADHLVHASNGDAVLNQFVAAHAGLQATPLQRQESAENEGGRRSTRTTWRDREGRAMAEQWVVHGAGHAWSGGCASGSHSDPQGPCASRAMLRFFLQKGS